MHKNSAVLRFPCSPAVKDSKVSRGNSVAEGQVRLLLTARRGIR